ncbi:hypothetical protein ACWCW7_27225 [Nocardia tengchongensis]
MINTEDLTVREVRAVGALAEMRALQLDVLGDHLRLGKSQTYVVVRKLASAGLIHHPLLSVQAGAKWVVPTPAAVAWMLGWRAGDWRPTPLSAEHCRAVAQTRVALGAYASHAWMSERVMRHQTPGPGRYPYDGRLILTDWQCVAVKVDTTRYLTPEDFTHRLHTIYYQARRDQCVKVLYVCGGYIRPESATEIATQVSRYGADLDFMAVSLDALLAQHRGMRQPDGGLVLAMRHRATGGPH